MRVAIGIVLLLLVPSVAAAEPRIALIITNQAYTQAGASLTNTHRDGELVKGALEKVGFKTWVVKDTGNEHALLQAIGEHVQRLADAGSDSVGFFYYSGHGAADRPNGENYLIPTNVPLTHASQLPLMAVRLEKITATLASAGRMSFVVFDACRNVPLQREQKDLAFKGFTPTREQRGLLVAFATESGNVAVDQSVYAKALADEIVKPGLEAGGVFRAVMGRVLNDTQGRQSPEYLDKRFKDFHFAAPIPDKEVVALKEKLAKMEGELKRQQEIGAGAAKETPKELKTSPSPFISTIRTLERQFEAERRKEEEQNKQRVASPAPTPDQPKAVAVKPLCESYSSRSSCQFDEVCAWAIDRKQCERKKGSLADAILEEMTVREGFLIDCKGVETRVGSGVRCLKAGSIFRDCPDCPQMVIVPAGTFTMGSPVDEEGRSNDEGPQRKVTIAKPFAVGRFEVTFAEWYACVSEKGCEHEPGDAGHGIGADKRPVINVSWGDITKEFLPWLSSKTGKTYRLLSEAEWEYAARAGTSTPFSTGGTITPDDANFDGKRATIEVGSFQANAFGLYDVHGNVREWVQDCYKDSYKGAPTDGSALPTADCSYRVVRGGSWSMNPWALRSASRYRFYAVDRDSAVGFRLGRTLSP